MGSMENGNLAKDINENTTEEYTTFKEVHDRCDYLEEQIRKHEHSYPSDLDENTVKDAYRELEELSKKEEELRKLEEKE